MTEEKTYDDAYTKALEVVKIERMKAAQLSSKQLPVTILKNLTRDIGTASEK